MSGISARSLLLAHLASFALFCLIGSVGYSVILISLRIFSHEDLAHIHQNLQSSSSFHDAFGASMMGLAAIGGGWVAAAISKTKPLVHGALSGVAFFILFLLDFVSDLIQFQSPEHLVARMHSPLTISEVLFPLFGLFGANLKVLMTDKSPKRDFE
jgi:hypothetical protein